MKNNFTEEQKLAMENKVNEIVEELKANFQPSEQKEIVEAIPVKLEEYYRNQIIENNTNLEQSKQDYKNFTDEDYEIPAATN
ncbi:hypothetical protein T190611E02C_40312 [Tenacibaculum sp. 190524A05c]|uniref:hypothetical protein n=1 Tax=Tenacibaculum platacis TaxID=3137852 RepID=UPI0031FA9649